MNDVTLSARIARPISRFDRRSFGVSEVRAQMNAALDAGGTGWMLWNPQTRYTAEALGPALALRS
ncbi:MAG: hypothetical protein C5B48_06865 [Candidatus Rokuibacteriota bacterium]|nr:MAG: hypothetical protein C5B48_06865 [Candidatus Rokubacteria bacterium]